MKELEKIFNEQVDVLVNKGYIEASGMSEESFLFYVNYLKISLPYLSTDNFIIVIPENIVPIRKMLTMIAGKKPDVMNLLEMFDVYAYLEKRGEFHLPYLIYNISVKHWGATRSGEELDEAHKNGHFGLNLQEGIALLTFKPEILKNSMGIILPGSHMVGRNNPLPKSEFGKKFIYSEKGGYMGRVAFPTLETWNGDVEDSITITQWICLDMGEIKPYSPVFCEGRVTHLDILKNPKIPNKIKLD